MQISAIEGVVENGKVRLRDPASLPENTRVFVIVADPNPTPLPSIQTPRLARPEQAKDFRKQIVEVQADAKL